MSQDKDRIIRLEEMLAHQMAAIDELSGQVLAQWRLLDETRVKLDRLTERFLGLEEQNIDAPAITRPPHY